MSYIGGEGNGDVSIFPGQGHKKGNVCSLFLKRKGDLLLVRCEIDLAGIEDNLLVWLAVLVGVFVRLEVAFDGHEIALLHEFEIGGVVFAAPCLDIDENGLADFGTVHGFLAADREREAGYAGLFKVIDCCIYCYETTHCEIVFHLFHIRCFFEVNNQFLRLPSQVVQIKGAPWNADEILFFSVEQKKRKILHVFIGHSSKTLQGREDAAPYLCN